MRAYADHNGVIRVHGTMPVFRVAWLLKHLGVWITQHAQELRILQRLQGFGTFDEQ